MSPSLRGMLHRGELCVLLLRHGPGEKPDEMPDEK